MITDKLASYGAAKREVMPGIEHRQHKRLNNRAENSHQPTRRRERQMKQFKSAGQLPGWLLAAGFDDEPNRPAIFCRGTAASEYQRGTAALPDLSRSFGPSHPQHLPARPPAQWRAWRLSLGQDSSVPSAVSEGRGPRADPPLGPSMRC
jgi:hypothetical protein